jgi:hypothetical protein
MESDGDIQRHTIEAYDRFAELYRDVPIGRLQKTMLVAEELDSMSEDEEESYWKAIIGCIEQCKTSIEEAIYWMRTVNGHLEYLIRKARNG